MIFITLGTQDKSFERLLKEIDLLIEKGIIKEKVIVQAGFTKYKSRNMEVTDFISNEQFEKNVKTCNYLITHGGVGSILTGLKNNKKIIAVPRLKKYNEHTNDHQLQIIKKFNDSKYIIGIDKVEELEASLKKIKKFKFRKYNFDNSKIKECIINFIDNN